MSKCFPSPRLNRRHFLQNTTTAGAVLLSSRALAAVGANDRLSIGIIGCGHRGCQHPRGSHRAMLEKLSQTHNVEITALCDVWKPNLQRAAALVKKHWGKEPRTMIRYGELLALKDVDAVTIVTPHFSHAPILIDAIKVGKDVYCEKPMAIKLDDANRAVDLAQDSDCIVQVGTQRRSDARYISAAQMLKDGMLGKVSRLLVEMNVNEPRWARDYSDCRREDVDWEAYLPGVPFDPRLLRRWHLFKICSNGISGEWLTHFADAAHLLMEAKYPARVAALGGTYVWKEDREHCDTYQAALEYPQEFLMGFGMGLGNSAGGCWQVRGTKGIMDLDKWIVSPEGGKNTQIKKHSIPWAEGIPQGESSTLHLANWLDCIRSRKRPRADIQCGHQHSVATIMAATALNGGRRQTYNVEKRTIQDG